MPPAADRSALERLLRRDRAVVVFALLVVIAAAWLYLLLGAGVDMPDMSGMESMAMPELMPVWSPSYFFVILLMWLIMMIAMMLPSAAPMILLHATMSRRSRELGQALPATGIFVLGYVTVWMAFCLAATLIQWALASAALLSPAMVTTSKGMAASILISAGIYEWTPFKRSCLRHCQSPLAFLLDNWRGGAWGNLTMGMRHGGYCLGCCWMLMLLLFAGGVMNLRWIAALALIVLVEKMASGRSWVARALGAVLMLWGGIEWGMLL